MKMNFKKLFFIAITSFSLSSVFAQSTEVTDSVMVNGNCGMCKNKIEKSAKEAGATYALWNKNTKMLSIRYNPSATTQEKIEKQVAAAGYDTRNVRAPDEAYKKLEDCCQYERKDLKFENQK